MMAKVILITLNYIGRRAKVETGMFPIGRFGWQKIAKSTPRPAIMGGCDRKASMQRGVSFIRSWLRGKAKAAVHSLLNVNLRDDLFDRSDVFHAHESLIQAIKEIGQPVRIKAKLI